MDAARHNLPHLPTFLPCSAAAHKALDLGSVMGHALLKSLYILESPHKHNLICSQMLALSDSSVPLRQRVDSVGIPAYPLWEKPRHLNNELSRLSLCPAKGYVPVHQKLRPYTGFLRKGNLFKGMASGCHLSESNTMTLAIYLAHFLEVERCVEIHSHWDVHSVEGSKFF